MDFYAILGVPMDADQETIRSAYRTLARRYHADRGAGSSTEKFRQAAQAYETLIDPRRRQGYNLSLQPARLPSVPASLPRENPEVFGRFYDLDFLEVNEPW